MMHLPASVRVYLCTSACDMRRSFDGLHALVTQSRVEALVNEDFMTFEPGGPDHVAAPQHFSQVVELHSDFENQLRYVIHGHRWPEDGRDCLGVTIQHEDCLRLDCSLGKPRDFDLHSDSSSFAYYLDRQFRETEDHDGRLILSTYFRSLAISSGFNSLAVRRKLASSRGRC